MCGGATQFFLLAMLKSILLTFTSFASTLMRYSIISWTIKKEPKALEGKGCV